jgi:ABC-type dipeptide/oligopeptide/nickel transport system permease component
MQRYILKRVIQGLICLVAISIIVFSLVHLSGDPAMLLLGPDATEEDYQEIRSRLGLDRPLYTQYFDYISRAVRGDLGQSIQMNRPTMEIFAERFPNTLELGLAAMVWALLLGIPIGIWSAVKVGTWFDNFGKIFALLGQATPVFWLGIMLVLLFSVYLRWLPTAGMGGIANLVLPSFTLGYYITASFTRLTRSTMLDVLDSEYIKMARIKGVSENMVIIKHAFKNAMLPVLTLGALNLIMLLNGAVLTETIFNWPGVGRLVVSAVFARDFPMVQTCLLIGSGLFVITNLLVDIIYCYIDPRIRYQ